MREGSQRGMLAGLETASGLHKRLTMETIEKSAERRIVPVGAQGLAVRSSTLVARGLRDLSRDSNWLIKKVFTGTARHLAHGPGVRHFSARPPQRPTRCAL